MGGNPVFHSHTPNNEGGPLKYNPYSVLQLSLKIIEAIHNLLEVLRLALIFEFSTEYSVPSVFSFFTLLCYGRNPISWKE